MRQKRDEWGTRHPDLLLGDEWATRQKQRQSLGSAVVCLHAKRRERYEVLFGGHFFLFAFHAHLLQFAFLGFDGRGDLLLDLRCRFLQLG